MKHTCNSSSWEAEARLQIQGQSWLHSQKEGGKEEGRREGRKEERKEGREGEMEEGREDHI
jgi:hypothetical protein